MTVLFEVVTPDRVVLSTDVDMVSLRGGGGELGILPRHTPLCTTVNTGIVRVRLGEGHDFIAVTSGFLQVVPDRITLLTNTAELGSFIDVERAERAKERAEKRLSDSHDAWEAKRAEAALRRALTRMEAAELSARYGDLLKNRLS